MTTKKEIVEQEKNRKQPELREVSSVEGKGVYGENWKDMIFSSEWKSEGVMDDDSGYDEGEEDWLRQGWRSAEQKVSYRDKVTNVGMNGLWF